MLAVVGLGEARRIVPVDGFAGVGEGDEVADAVAEPLADERAEDALLSQLGRRCVPPRVRREASGASSVRGRGFRDRVCRKRSRLEPAGASGRPSPPISRWSTISGQSSLTYRLRSGSIAAMPWSAVIRTSVPSGKASAQQVLVEDGERLVDKPLDLPHRRGRACASRCRRPAGRRTRSRDRRRRERCRRRPLRPRSRRTGARRHAGAASGRACSQRSRAAARRARRRRRRSGWGRSRRPERHRRRTHRGRGACSGGRLRRTRTGAER